ncbi:nitroreductase family protein [Pacificimonas flava]|uniref:Nitroreductase family protein n=2 Tax=Pacificimonas TaxID=1960290 RepID=A0A219B4D2_9SPHN|nr:MULTISPECIES: nitroreductase family protein [Pacificimonas]MBZ6377042.1 nitroreductase family protein [Pacificimonas aurantium]OWV33217.1 nitroreductase family protein [Pacificimonas flava]
MTGRTMPFPVWPDLRDEERVTRARHFLEVMRRRRTCRSFSAEGFPREVLEDALRAAGTAPSGANHQPWHFVVVETPKIKARIREGAEAEEREFYAGKASDEWLEALAPLGTDAVKEHLTDAPYLVVVFAQRRGGPAPGDDLQNYYVTESVGIACGLLLAALTQAGIATLTHTPSPMKFLNEICGRPDREKPLMIIACGHPADDATVREHALRKKTLEQFSTWL